MDYIDYYKILGLTKAASQDDIKKAYRRLARQHHPDLNPDDREAQRLFQQINEANEVLSDPDKRKKYDQYGKDWKHAEEFEKTKQSGAQSFGSRANDFGGYSFSGDFNEGGFSDFFSSMFGGSGEGHRRQHAKFRGQDYNAELHLQLKDAYKTHQQTLTINNEHIRITIPAGVENGQKIKLKGRGAPGVNGGPSGDLYLTFVIEEHPVFKRLGDDLYATHEIDLYTATLGGETTVETFDGKLKIKVKPETQNGSKIKLKGKGFPVYKHEGSFGDLYITYSVKIPTNLTDEQKQLFIQLSKLSS